MKARCHISARSSGIPILVLFAVFGLACTQSDTPDQQPEPSQLSQQQSESSTEPSYIFINGKVLTVDEEFSTAEAVAVTGNTLTAVGSSEDLAELAGASTQIIDLNGRTLIPGLIDNHNHLIYNAPIWPNNVRLGNIRTRAEALEIIAAKAEEIGPGDDADHMVFAMGGWKPLQFTDDSSNFTLEELDKAVPNNPVFVGGWGGANINTKAMQFTGLNKDTPDPDPSVGKIWRDENGELTGRFTGSVFIKWELRPLFPEVNADTVVRGLIEEIDDYLALGVTTSQTFNGPEFPEPLMYHIRDTFADTPAQKMRIYYPPHFNNNVSAMNVDEVDYVLEGLATQKPFDGSDMFQLTHFGEHVYLPIPGNGKVSDEDWAIFKQIATAAAANGWQLAEHAHRHSIIEKEIEIFEEINQQYPLEGLRWRIEHNTTISADQIERLKNLGMLMSIESHVSISSPESRANSGYMKDVIGERDMPPLAAIRDSGISYAFGSDAQVGGNDSPFFSIYWVVTGKDTTGEPYFTRGTLTREEALIAVTRSAAYSMFKEDKLGTLEPGKLADLVVLDRDYMTVPEDDIRYLKSMLTMVDGRIVYQDESFSTEATTQ